MLVLISYDVNTQDAAGRRRLRLIAKQCVNYGQRVQNSVFECILDAAQCRQLQHKLCSLMDKEKDSLRFYYLGNRYEAKVEHFGINAGYQPEGVLMVLSVRTGSEQRFFGRFAPKFVHVWQKKWPHQSQKTAQYDQGKCTFCAICDVLHSFFVQDRCPAPQGAGGLKFPPRAGRAAGHRPAPQGAGGLKYRSPELDWVAVSPAPRGAGSLSFGRLFPAMYGTEYRRRRIMRFGPRQGSAAVRSLTSCCARRPRSFS